MFKRLCLLYLVFVVSGCEAAKDAEIQPEAAPQGRAQVVAADKKDPVTPIVMSPSTECDYFLWSDDEQCAKKSAAACNLEPHCSYGITPRSDAPVCFNRTEELAYAKAGLRCKGTGMTSTADRAVCDLPMYPTNIVWKTFETFCNSTADRPSIDVVGLGTNGFDVRDIPHRCTTINIHRFGHSSFYNGFRRFVDTMQDRHPDTRVSFFDYGCNSFPFRNESEKQLEIGQELKPRLCGNQRAEFRGTLIPVSGSCKLFPDLIMDCASDTVSASGDQACESSTAIDNPCEDSSDNDAADECGCVSSPAFQEYVRDRIAGIYTSNFLKDMEEWGGGYGKPNYNGGCPVLNPEITLGDQLSFFGVQSCSVFHRAKTVYTGFSPFGLLCIPEELSDQQVNCLCP